MNVEVSHGREAEEPRPSFPARFPVLRTFLVVPVNVVVLGMGFVLIYPLRFGGYPSTTELILTLVALAALAVICGKFTAPDLGPEPSLAETLPNVGIFLATAFALALLVYAVEGAPAWVRSDGELYWRLYALSTGASIAIGFAAGQQRERLRRHPVAERTDA